jgi:hypothetical protein
MTETTLAERRGARRYVDRLVKRGAIVAPLRCPFVEAFLLTTDQLPLCAHKDEELRAGLAVLPTFDGTDSRMMRLMCLECFEAEPLQRWCQVCERRPSPGLRTIVARPSAHAVVLVGRICRDCRPGRVA